MHYLFNSEGHAGESGFNLTCQELVITELLWTSWTDLWFWIATSCSPRRNLGMTFTGSPSFQTTNFHELLVILYMLSSYSYVNDGRLKISEVLAIWTAFSNASRRQRLNVKQHETTNRRGERSRGVRSAHDRSISEHGPRVRHASQGVHKRKQHLLGFPLAPALQNQHMVTVGLLRIFKISFCRYCKTLAMPFETGPENNLPQRASANS